MLQVEITSSKIGEKDFKTHQWSSLSIGLYDPSSLHDLQMNHLCTQKCCTYLFVSRISVLKVKASVSKLQAICHWKWANQNANSPEECILMFF